MKEDHEIIYRSLLTDNPPNPGEVDNTTGIYVPYTLFELWYGFFYVHKNQISESAVRQELRLFVLIRED